MTLTLSPQMRIFALVGAIVAVAGALAMFMLGRGAAEPAAIPAPVSAPAPAAPAPAPAAAETAAPKAAAAKKADVAKAAAAPTPVAKPKPVLPPSGLPAALDAALARNAVVVVSLYVPGARVDKLALDEARAGAKLSGVGFLALNVLDERQAKPLLTKIGMLEDPSVLVFTRPAKVAVKLTGFVDRDTVAQAASNASA
jgi:thiol:disulfide interchange protein